jgi:hypothetical protein
MIVVKVSFTIVLAVGIKGVAVMKLDEKVREVFGARKEEVPQSGQVLHDIECSGIDEWFESNIKKKPHSSGMYTYTGVATLDEDSAHYEIESMISEGAG